MGNTSSSKKKLSGEGYSRKFKSKMYLKRARASADCAKDSNAKEAGEKVGTADGKQADRSSLKMQIRLLKNIIVGDRFSEFYPHFGFGALLDYEEKLKDTNFELSEDLRLYLMLLYFLDSGYAHWVIRDIESGKVEMTWDAIERFITEYADEYRRSLEYQSVST